MNVIAVSRRKEITYMKTFTIDAENNVSVFATKKEAAAASTTPFDTFTSQNELAELAADWPMSRFVEIWNSIPGVNAVTKFTNRKVASERIWKAIQGLGALATAPVPEEGVVPAQEASPEPEATAEASAPPAEEIAAPPEPTSEPIPETMQDATSGGEATPQATQDAQQEALASVSEQAPEVAPAETEPSNKAGRAKKAPKAPKVAKPAKSESGPREGSKTAQVVAMVQREGGATLAEIMTTMAWQKHTVRGFMAGAMKKAGYAVESFKPAGGERTYRIKK
jgi:hypothetical protein